MVLRPWAALLALLLMTTVGSSTPAVAHKEHDKQAKQAATQPITESMVSQSASPSGRQRAMTEHMEEMAEQVEAETPKSWSARVIDWIGRVHPFAVHFPLALFPVSWLALMLARRRGDTVDVIRSLILVAGASAAIAGILGWLDAGFDTAKDDWLLTAHRWLGTALGLSGAAIAVWTWRRTSSVNSRIMSWVLGTVTLLLLVQGWFGGALVHGVDHMNL